MDYFWGEKARWGNRSRVSRREEQKTKRLIPTSSSSPSSQFSFLRSFLVASLMQETLTFTFRKNQQVIRKWTQLRKRERRKIGMNEINVFFLETDFLCLLMSSWSKIHNRHPSVKKRDMQSKTMKKQLLVMLNDYQMQETETLKTVSLWMIWFNKTSSGLHNRNFESKEHQFPPHLGRKWSSWTQRDIRKLEISFSSLHVRLLHFSHFWCFPD